LRILITGGAGFIGAFIARRLSARGHALRVLDVKDDRRLALAIIGAAAERLDWRVGDVSNRSNVEGAAEGCEAIVHLAALLTPACAVDPLRGAAVNVDGTLNVFLAAQARSMTAVVYMSSAGVFGPEDGINPKPITQYGTFKLAMEGCARAFWADHRVPSVGFRPYVVYGPGREIGMTAGISLACRAAARGEAYAMPYTGAADYIYVDDVAAAFEAAIAAPIRGAEVFNLLGVTLDAEAALDEIRRQVPGARLRCEGAPLPVASRIAADRLRTVYPDLPTTDLARGIAATIAFHRRSA
jgi:nucleoside-diphosphate-sugar epimerase